MSLPNAAQAAAALSQMLEQHPDCKAMLSSISGRLNDIDLKLSVILEMLNKQQQQHPQAVLTPSSTATSLPGLPPMELPPASSASVSDCFLSSSNLASQIAAAVSTANLLNQSAPAAAFLNDPSIASRLLAACQERPELSSALNFMHNMPKLDAVVPKVEPDAAASAAMLWQQTATGSTQPSPTDPTELMAAAMAAAAAAATTATATTRPSSHGGAQVSVTPIDERHKTAGSADSKAFSDEPMDENEEEEEFEFEDEGDSPPATTSKQSGSELSPTSMAAFEASFPEGAVKRAAEKAARSFQSTQPKVFAWQILRESITDDELKNIQISLRTFHGETAGHLLSRQLPKIRSVVEMTMHYFKWDSLSEDAQLGKAKLLLSHLKNNAKVRNWTLREGRPNRDSRASQNTDVLWRKYAALLNPNSIPALNLFSNNNNASSA